MTCMLNYTMLNNNTHQNAIIIGSGFTYKLLFDNQNDNDRVIKDQGIEIYVDAKSLLYLMGTQIDFVNELNQSGFKFSNPNAKRTCGCGESFSV